MDAEKAKRMLKAIEKEREKGDMDEGAYQILRKKYKGVLRGLGAEAREEAAIKPPEGEAPEDVKSLAASLISDVNDLKEEIVVLESERKSTEGLLKDLKDKFDKNSIGEEKFERLSEKHESKVGDLESQISENQEQIKQIKGRLKEIAGDVEKDIEDYKRILKKIKKFEKG